jgi:hypothetical protein
MAATKPVFDPGEVLTSDKLNQLADFAAEPKVTAAPGSGLRMVRSAGGIVSFMLERVFGLVFVQTPGAGITARAGTVVHSGSCTRLKFDLGAATLSTDAQSLTCYNPWNTNAPAGKYAVAANVFGVFWLIAWDCG